MISNYEVESKIEFIPLFNDLIISDDRKTINKSMTKFNEIKSLLYS